VTTRVDIWWTKGRELAGPTDTRIHCRASGVSAGLPAGWRGGERGQFLAQVMAHYPQTSEANSARAVAQGWRLNGGGGAHFSLSDTGTCYIAGVGVGVPLGIDAEALRPVPEGLQTLRRLGLNDAAAALERLPAAPRNRAFLRIWTAFESFLKLERLPWEAGAARFAALQRHWIIGAQGNARFQGHHAGVHFQHAEVGKMLLVGIATPMQATIEVQRITLPLRPRRTPGISSATTRL
jgi:hypothetical protein